MSVAAVAAGVLLGCGGNHASDVSMGRKEAKPLAGTFVSTSDVQEDGTAFSTPVTVDFGEFSVGWQADCNSIGAKHVKITDDRLVLDEAAISSTLIGCAEGPQGQDHDLTTFFKSNPEWSLDGNRLTLSNESVTVVLQRDATPSDH